MRLAHRFGSIAAAGLLACGSLGAAQTTPQEPSPTPTEEPPSSTLPDTSSPSSEITTENSEVPETPEPEQTERDAEDTPEPDPPAPPTDDDTGAATPEISCDLVETHDGSALIEIPDANAQDVVTVGDSGPSFTVNAASQIEMPVDVPTSLTLSLWQGEETEVGQCSVEVPEEDTGDEPSDQEPTETETPSDPGEPEPTDPGTPEPTDPGTPEPTDPDTPSGPTQSPEENPDTQPTSPAQTAPPETHVPLPSTPQPSTPRSSPTNEAPPVTPPSGGWNDTPTQPPQQSTPSTQPSTQSTEPVERDIRPYSNNPRHLLSDFWGTDSHNGSRLIMPGPRDSESQPNELETLPPVSEDELDAIKAQQATQDNGQGVNSDDELTGTDIGQRLSDSQSWWLLSTVAGIVVLGGGIWWAVSTHRNRQH